jgi:hypothetical protein
MTEEIRSRRVTLPDLWENGTWLIERLKVKYPNLSDQVMHGWLRSKLEGNEWLFLTNDYGMCLFEMIHETLTPQCSIIERFILARDIKDAECIRKAGLLYADVWRWAVSMGARDIIVEQFCDIPRKQMKEHLGELYIREWLLAKTERKARDKKSA